MYIYKKLKSDFFSEGMGYIYFEGAIKKKFDFTNCM